MAVTTALHLRGMRSTAERWSFVAFLLAVVGLVLSIWFVLSSQSDTSEVRWWLVVAPLFAAATPVLLPRHAVRVGAMVALGVWSFLTVFSIGTLLVPALLAAVIAAGKSN